MIISFVPLRCGSKSIKFKNIKEFCEKPLSFWCLEALQHSKVDKIFVATDCEKIKKTILSFKFDKVEIYNRKKENAQDTSSTESVMLEFIKERSFQNDDTFMLVQATSPFIESLDIDNALKMFKDKKSDSLLSCTRTKRFFWNDSYEALNYDFKKRPRRQDFRGLLMENGALYITTIKNFLHSQNRLNGKISIYEMQAYKGIELDEPEDWEIAEILMRKYQKRRLDKVKQNLNIKLFLSDVDGTLTDGGMYYSNNDIEMKKFNATDGKGFEILRTLGIKTGILTSENNSIITKRAEKLKIDYVYMGLSKVEKFKKIEEICQKEKISLKEVAFIGDDINDILALSQAGIKACPKNAHQSVKKITGMICLSKKGGDGAVREFIDILTSKEHL